MVLGNLRKAASAPVIREALYTTEQGKGPTADPGALVDDNQGGAILEERTEKGQLEVVVVGKPCGSGDTSEAVEVPSEGHVRRRSVPPIMKTFRPHELSGRHILTG